jgi:hypothetical protein
MAKRDRAYSLLRSPVFTAESAREIVECIRALSDDDELAHALEDDLHFTVLQHVAKGGANSQELAAVAVTTEALDFSRWCA